MPHRFAVLGLLEDGPSSGCQLTTRFERSLQRFAWTARQSHIYPELARMAEDGLIEVAEEGARNRRTYALTEAGRAALREWLLAPPKPRSVRDEESLRRTLMSALEPAEARAIVTRDLAEAESIEQELREARQRWAKWALAVLEG